MIKMHHNAFGGRALDVCEILRWLTNDINATKT